MALTGTGSPRFPTNFSSSCQTFLKAYYASRGPELGSLTSLTLISDSAFYLLGNPWASHLSFLSQGVLTWTLGVILIGALCGQVFKKDQPQTLASRRCSVIEFLLRLR